MGVNGVSVSVPIVPPPPVWTQPSPTVMPPPPPQVGLTCHLREKLVYFTLTQ